MITPIVQRWRERRGSYRPASEVIDPRCFAVAPIAEDKVAKTFVERHHYSGSYPAARFRFGLYQDLALVGVAVFSHPCNDKALRPLPGEPIESVELGRFVLLDSVAANGETWFLARCLEHLRREGLLGVVSFSDPIARSGANGIQVFRGHIGGIYQASSAIFVGLGTARTLRLLPDGSVFSARAAQKVRKLERGWQYAVAQLVAHGADALTGDPVAWLARAQAMVTRPLRHPGCLKYVLPLGKGVRKHLPASQPYPKFSAPVTTGGAA